MWRNTQQQCLQPKHRVRVKLLKGRATQAAHAEEQFYERSAAQARSQSRQEVLDTAHGRLLIVETHQKVGQDDAPRLFTLGGGVRELHTKPTEEGWHHSATELK